MCIKNKSVQLFFRTISLGIALGLVGACSHEGNGSRKLAQFSTAEGTGATSDVPKHVPQQLLIALKSELSLQQRSDLFASFRVKEVQKLGSLEIYLVTTPADANLDELIKKIQHDPKVKYVEKNGIVSIPKPIQEGIQGEQ